MAPERAVHARIKGRFYLRLDEAIRAGNLLCEVFPDGLAVQVDATTIYEPDVRLRCGALLDGHAIEVGDPLILIEMASRLSNMGASGGKLEDYFRLAP